MSFLLIHKKSLLQKVYGAYYFLLPLPFFLTTSLTLYRGGETDPGTNMIAFGFLYGLAVLALQYLVDGLRFRKNILYHSSTTILTFFVVFYIGSIIVGGMSYSPLLLIANVAPMVLGLILGYSSKQYLDMEQIYSWLIKSMVFFCILFVASSFLEYGFATFIRRGSDSLFGIFGIHNKLSYLPSIIASVIIILYFSRHTLFVKYGLIFLLSLTIIIIANREGLVFLMGGSMLCAAYYYKRKIVYWNLLLLLIGVVSIIYIFDIDLAQIRVFERFAKVLFAENVNELSGLRSDRIAGQMDRILNNLLLGTGFLMKTAAATPHNQYLEIILRSGLVGLIPLLLLMIYLYMLGYKSPHRKKLMPILIILFLYMVLTMNLRTPLRIPYSALYIWTLFGLLIPNDREE